MPAVLPFRGVRPHLDLVNDLMGHPFDYVILEKEQGIELAEVRNRAQELGFDLHREPQMEYFIRVGIGYRKLLQRGLLLLEDKPCYYLIGVNWQGEWVHGLVGAVHYAEYWNGSVKRHEDTLEANELELIKITEAIDFNFNPIMLAYPDHHDIQHTVEEACLHKETYHYFNNEGVEHKLWVLRDHAVIEGIRRAFTDVSATYIADGHHRIASGAQIARIRSEKDGSPQHSPHNYFIGIHFPAKQVKLYEFNRLVKDLGPYGLEGFMQLLANKFAVAPQEGPYRPETKYSYGMYLDGKWYRLDYLHAHDLDMDPYARLDVVVLRREVITGILGVSNLRTSDKMWFVEGVRGLDPLVQAVDSGDYRVAFTLCPAGIDEIFAISNCGETMPPKATCIEPKLKSGMISRMLSD